MKRALAVAALLLCAAPAGAQEPVRGGASFRRAPVLEPGEHRDTIRPGETLYYGVDVAEGEVLVVRAILRSGDRVRPLATRLRIYNAQRVEDPTALDAGFIRPPGTLGLVTRSAAVGGSSVDHPTPGIQYFSVSVGGRVGAELDLTLGVKVKPAPEREIPAVLDPPPPPPPEEPSRRGTYALAALLGALAGGLAMLGLSKLRQAPKALRHRL